MAEVLNSSDLQIFLPTYHRPELLRKTIQSVLQQTVKIEHICVLDNGGFPETRELLSEFESTHIEYVDTRHLGHWGNLLAAQQRLSCEYVLLLHDDDLIHPEYIEVAFKVLNANARVNLLSARTVPWFVDQSPVSLPSLTCRGHLFSPREYATYVYNAGHPSYSLAIYKADAFKSLDIQDIFERFGKWGDVPLMLSTIQDGKAIVFTDACGWGGEHAGQDSNDESNLPSYRSWIYREALFYRFLKDSLTTRSGLSFCIMNYRRMRSGYKRRVRKEVSFKQYLAEARAEKALTRRGELARFISWRFVQKLFQRYHRGFYRRVARELS